MKRSLSYLVPCLALVLVLATPAMCMAEGFDLGGRTVKIASVKVNEGMADYFAKGEGRGRIQAVEKEFNCKIELVPFAWDGAENMIMSTILSGDPIGDIIYVTNGWISTLARNGAILALDDYLTEDYYESLPGLHKNMREIYSTYQGKAYAISINGDYQRNMDIGSSQGWIYNRDMYKEAGLATPNELQETGDWTFETMRQAAIKLTRDVDGDGQIDVYGVHARIDPWPIEPEMAMYANGGGIVVKGEDGKMVFGGNKEEALTAIQMWRDLVKVDKVVQIGDQYDGRAEFNRGTNAQLRLDLFALPSHAQEVNFDYGWVFFPKGPDAEDYINPVWGLDCLVLPITCKEPEAMIAIANMLFETTADYRDLDTYDDEFLEFFMPYVTDRASLETIRQMIFKVRLWDNIPGMTDDFRFALTEAVLGDESPKAVMDRVAPVVQGLIDAAYN
jgi:multiple sugar transport system substrate-binding protein